METVNELEDLDRQLREAAPYIDDDGFTRRVLAVLPARRVRRQPVRAAILLGASLVASVLAYFLSGGGQFVSEGLVKLSQLSPLVLIGLAGAVCMLATGIGVAAAFSSNREFQTGVWSRN
jgi:hypothetical protein